MKQIKPIEYENIIVNVVDEVYVNFKQNSQKDFEFPKNISEFFEKNDHLTKRKDIETFGVELDKTFGDWKVIDENLDKLIIINHLLAILQNSVIVLMSIDKNLENEKLPTKVIEQMGGVDLIVATGVQALGVKANELTEMFDELELSKDPLIIFDNLNKLLTKVKNLEAQQAFSLFMENILEFNLSYKNCYEKLSQLNVDEMSDKRVQMFMEYMNAQYLFVFLLRLTLIYPLQENMMPQEAFNNIIPNINLY
ncbi:hypothetical protein [Spiroplasma culicicola]|uniref:Uncharacterized protein n=1 Tax=Spiroplasma culicicola AES-1 TaxID=1276246 RepID=W6AI22_9MOLU|nr:hypothetical protein [Spiroplasma culicicola]AHI53349.1 hypothetical protein SCULI_v1c10090 [Spiroplasma culicicola AES-1]